MDKSLAQSTISKSKPVSSSSDSEDDCDKKCIKPRTIWTNRTSGRTLWIIK